MQQAGVRRSVWLLVAAAALVVLALVLAVRPLLMRPAPAEVALPAQAPAARPAGAGPAAPGAVLARKPLPPPAGDLPAAAGEEAPAPPEEEAPAPPEEVAGALQAAMDEAAAQAAAEGGDGEPSGIALFPPPGTNPPKSGIVVPEDFELPPGYTRHHQMTDDGKPLQAILMFHPDFVLLDENGAEVELPADRVVPPELAPPGLPIEMLQVPESDVPMVEIPEER